MDSDKEFAYQFYSFDNKGLALKNLSETSLYFNRMDKFNDPFEGRPYTFMPKYSALLDEQYIQVVRRCVEEKLIPKNEHYFRSRTSGIGCYGLLKSNVERLSESTLYDYKLTFGITCLTTKLKDGPEPLSNPLMWSHYADGFKGFCIQFDVEKLANGLEDKGAYLLLVDYTNERPTINGFEFFRDWNRPEAENPFTAQKVVDKLFATKHKAWAYESEFRFFHKEVCQRTLQYPLEAIEKVIVSGNARPENIDMIKSTLKALGIGEFSIATLHPEKYGIRLIDGCGV